MDEILVHMYVEARMFGFTSMDSVFRFHVVPNAKANR